MNHKHVKISFHLILSSILISSCSIFYSPSEEEIKEGPKNFNYKTGEFVNSNPTKGMT